MVLVPLQQSWRPFFLLFPPNQRASSNLQDEEPRKKILSQKKKKKKKNSATESCPVISAMSAKTPKLQPLPRIGFFFFFGFLPH